MSEKADPESQPEEKIDPKYWEDILDGNNGRRDARWERLDDLSSFL